MKNHFSPKEIYNLFNDRYFRGRLPDIPVVWSKTQYKKISNRKSLGGTEFSGKPLKPIRIILNPRYRSADVIWVGTLLHEMVHVEQWRLPRSQAHGRRFNKRIKQLVNQGAYRGLL
jgi:hypothetical protein